MTKSLITQVARDRRKAYRGLSILGLIDAIASGNPKAVGRYAVRRVGGKLLRKLTSGQ